MSEWRVSGFDEVRELGRGAQGRVVLARHAGRGTPVAIKYLTPGADPAARERFRREARLLGQVRHPHVARLYRLVEHEEHLAILMEAVNGVPFKEILTRYGTLEPVAALAVLKGSLEGLAAAHALGVVHRDYKPANVIVPADGGSKLIDFGVATVWGEASGAGTPLYMAPEQWRGEPASPATDVYAAACVFYEAVTGARPYGAGLEEVRAGHLSGPVPVEGVPEAVRPLVERGMAKDAYDRPLSAAAFVGELENVAQSAYGADWEARGLRALTGASVAMAALFPLVAAGMAPAVGGTAAATASSGVIAALGAKATVAVAGAAIVGTTAATVGVYQVARSEPPKRRPVVAATTTPAGVPMQAGRLRLSVPKGWRITPLEKANYRVNVGGRCTRRVTRPGNWGYNDLCPSFAVMDEYGLGWKGPDLYDGTYRKGRPFHPANDVGHPCPPDGAYEGAVPDKLLRKATVRVGSRKAEFYEWRLRCTTTAPGGGVGMSDKRFLQRTWLVPDLKILIVDEWEVPGLDQILARAAWTA